MQTYLSYTGGLAEATPDSRNRIVDFWRVIAIGFVVFGHWLAASIWLQPDGEIALLNPSEQMNVAAATALADMRGLEGLARETLLNYANRAERHFRWSEADLRELFAETGFEVTDTTTRNYSRSVPEAGRQLTATEVCTTHP